MCLPHPSQVKNTHAVAAVVHFWVITQVVIDRPIAMAGADSTLP